MAMESNSCSGPSVESGTLSSCARARRHCEQKLLTTAPRFHDCSFNAEWPQSRVNAVCHTHQHRQQQKTRSNKDKHSGELFQPTFRVKSETNNSSKEGRRGGRKQKGGLTEITGQEGERRNRAEWRKDGLEGRFSEDRRIVGEMR